MNKTKHFGTLLSAVMICSLAFAMPAHAAGITDFLNNIIAEIDSAKVPLAILGFSLVTLACVFGIFDIRKAAVVIFGIICLFAAPEIVDMITS